MTIASSGDFLRANDPDVLKRIETLEAAPGGGSTPTGTGFIHVTDGVQDRAAVEPVIRSATVTLTAADLAALDTVPFELVAAQGAGKIVGPSAFVAVVRLNGGVSPAVAAATVFVQYASGTGFGHFQANGDIYQFDDLLNRANGDAVDYFANIIPMDGSLANGATPCIPLERTGVENHGIQLASEVALAVPGAIATSSLSNGGTGYAALEELALGDAVIRIDTTDGAPAPAINFAAAQDPLLNIMTVNTGTKTFTVPADGNYLNDVFMPGGRFKVEGSTGNDGLYTVASRSWSVDRESVVVVEAIPSAVADGTIIRDIFSIPGSASDFPVGTAVTVAGTVANDGAYVVSARLQVGGNVFVVPEENIPAVAGAGGTLSKDGVTYGNGEVLTYTVTEAGTNNIVGAAQVPTGGGGADFAVDIDTIDYSVNPVTLTVKTLYSVMDVA